MSAFAPVVAVLSAITDPDSRHSWTPRMFLDADKWDFPTRPVLGSKMRVAANLGSLLGRFPAVSNWQTSWDAGRSMDKKYQVFVSSTFRDLADERQTAIRNILDLGHVPAGMELFPAADTEQLTYIKKVIDQCDYYVLIMGGRYGSMDNAGVSFTEREYDYAVDMGKIVLAFPHADIRGRVRTVS
jgi:hypothetical protein